MATADVRCTLNGRELEFEVDHHSVLLDFLRELGLTGAKPSCEMEVCGACTVLLDGLPMSACTTLTLEIDGRRVETIEGLADESRLHPLQSAFIKHFALQCGYCTPGMILTAKALLDHHPRPDRDGILHWMEGNICRCTGYESILRAVQDVARAEGRA